MAPLSSGVARVVISPWPYTVRLTISHPGGGSTRWIRCQLPLARSLGAADVGGGSAGEAVRGRSFSTIAMAVVIARASAIPIRTGYRRRVGCSVSAMNGA